MTYQAIGGFADLWLYADQEQKFKPRERDYRADVVAAYACGKCGAKAGVACRRLTAMGMHVLRRMPHMGRGRPGRR